MFTGFEQDTFLFLMEIALHNNKEFFEKNRERYKRVLQKPLQALASDLLPDMLAIDPMFNPNLASIVSRIYRDTRYTKDKSPYRDHAWIGFRYPNTAVSESFSFYFEVTPGSYGYGMGMYDANPALMAPVRSRILADPAGFLSLMERESMKDLILEGDSYKRDRFPDADPKIRAYLNCKSLCWSYSSGNLSRTMSKDLVPELKQGFSVLAPVYAFLTGKRRG